MRGKLVKHSARVVLVWSFAMLASASATSSGGDVSKPMTLCAPQIEGADWCKALPRPEYKSLKRVAIMVPWFEVYEPVPGVYAIYEPHQAEETISYLIVGDKQALLFDTGMGISDIKKTVRELTTRPIVVLNSHTHNDHVGCYLDTFAHSRPIFDP